MRAKEIRWIPAFAGMTEGSPAAMRIFTRFPFRALRFAQNDETCGYDMYDTIKTIACLTADAATQGKSEKSWNV